MARPISSLRGGCGWPRAGIIGPLEAYCEALWMVSGCGTGVLAIRDGLTGSLGGQKEESGYCPNFSEHTHSLLKLRMAKEFP